MLKIYQLYEKFHLQKWNFFFAILALCIGLIIKYFYSIADNSQLQFVLFPIHLFVELQTGYQGIFSTEKGYVFTDLNICIDKSCAGLNFWVIAFLSCSFVVIKKAKQIKYLPIYLVILLSVSFLVTLFANTSRILVNLIALRSFPTLAKQTWFHEAQGVFIFVSVLLFFYISVSYFMEMMQSKAS